jgi:hypothetical protein
MLCADRLLGELNWIFTAITNTIAWISLPRALFQKLFCQVSLWLCVLRCVSALDKGQGTSQAGCSMWNSLLRALFQKLFRQVR